MTEELHETNPLAEIVTVTEVIKHPNADALDIISPDGSGINWAIVTRGSLSVGDKVVWIDAMNDPVVPMDREEFSMLLLRAKGKPTYRIRAMKLRDFLSRGIIIPYNEEWGNTNEAVTASLGITKWEPGVINGRGGGSIKIGFTAPGPDSLLPTMKYDVDSLNRNWAKIPEGAIVHLTEKVHGANACFGWLPYKDEGIMFRARSRNMWKKKEGGDSWWTASENCGLEEKLRDHPGIVVYGEIFGQVQDLRYGRSGVDFIAFDVWDSLAKKWFTWEEVKSFCESVGISHVPEILRFQWNKSKGIPADVKIAAEGPTTVPGGATHTREGVVLRWDGLVASGYETYSNWLKDSVPDGFAPLPGESVFETDARLLSSLGITSHPSSGDRFILKLVGNGYLTR